MDNKFLLSIFSFLYITAGFAQKSVFNIRYSEQLAVFVFIQNLSDNYPANPFKKEFTASSYNNQVYKDLVREFDTLAIDYTYPFSGYPYGTKLPGMTKELLKKNLIATDNLIDFKLRSIGLVPNNSLNRLCDILMKFAAVYNQLIYEPNKQQFEKQLAAIIKYSEQNDMAKYLETGLLFYNASWDNSIPFEIAFYPLPNSQGFTAQAFYNNFISAIETKLTDYKDLFSVMLHEIFHIVYDEQPLAVKNKLYQDFKQHPSKCSTYAYLLLNEVLATALGNGYVYEKLSGAPDANDWYNAKYINLMAKQIYPLVSRYIAEKRPIDDAFIDTYINLYEQYFPGWINEMDNLMTYRYILSEKIEDFNTIGQLYRRRSMSEAEDNINESSIDKMKATPLTKIVIISKNNPGKLKLIARKFPELKNWKYNTKEEFEYSVFLSDNTWLFIINQKNSSTETLFKNIKNPQLLAASQK